jgi:hypothetical protein
MLSTTRSAWSRSTPPAWTSSATFAAFYQEVKGMPLVEEKRRLFAETYAEVQREEGGAV